MEKHYKDNKEKQRKQDKTKEKANLLVIFINFAIRKQKKVHPHTTNTPLNLNHIMKKKTSNFQVLSLACLVHLI